MFFTLPSRMAFEHLLRLRICVLSFHANNVGIIKILIVVDAFTCPTSSIISQFIRHRELVEDDERAGRSNEGSWKLAWRPVSVFNPNLEFCFAKQMGIANLVDLCRFMAASKVLGEESVKEAGK
jgi:hypothetical protein